MVSRIEENENEETYLSIGELGNRFRIDGMLPQSFLNKCKHFFVEPKIKPGIRPIKLYPINRIIELAKERGHLISFYKEKEAHPNQALRNENEKLKDEIKKLKSTISAMKPKFAELKSMFDIMMSRVSYKPIIGIYFLFNDDECIYIGQSVNVMARIGSHVKMKNFNSYAYIEYPEEKLNEMETLYILTYKPILNRCSNRYYAVPCSDTKVRFNLVNNCSL